MRQSRTYPLYFVVPLLLLYCTLFIVPNLIGIYFSFTDWNRYSPEINFTGLENFRTLFTSTRNYAAYILHTLLFTVASNVVKIVPALFLALLLDKRIAGRNVYRAILFLPAILSFLVTGLIFRAMLHPSHGLLNQLLRAVHLPFLAGQWLADPRLVWPSILAVDAWKGIGYVMTIFLAGLQSIPAEYHDAAEIDGANGWQRLRAVTLPLLGPAVTVNVVFGLTYGMRVFDIIYVLTNGGPGRMTEVINTAVFNEFSSGTYGLGTALSSLLFVVMAVVGFGVVRFMMRREVQA